MKKVISSRTLSAATHKARKEMTQATRNGHADGDIVATKTGLCRARAALTPVLSGALDWIANYLVLHKDEILMCKGNLETGGIKSQCSMVRSDTWEFC